MSPMEELHFLDALLTVELGTSELAALANSVSDAEFQTLFADPKEEDAK